mmetsp:Transcript_22937/g.40599  ORF Transcript_22937/g.40599 Transcript_22937/m.40599 type:complete len:237 (-) Transcript_22937:302-1012(-)
MFLTLHSPMLNVSNRSFAETTANMSSSPRPAFPVRLSVRSDLFVNDVRLDVRLDVGLDANPNRSPFFSLHRGRCKCSNIRRLWRASLISAVILQPLLAPLLLLLMTVLLLLLLFDIALELLLLPPPAPTISKRCFLFANTGGSPSIRRAERFARGFMNANVCKGRLWQAVDLTSRICRLLACRVASISSFSPVCCDDKTRRRSLTFSSLWRCWRLRACLCSSHVSKTSCHRACGSF